jgi:colanic acid/amylovoran biosynthesis protein
MDRSTQTICTIVARNPIRYQVLYGVEEYGSWTYDIDTKKIGLSSSMVERYIILGANLDTGNLGVSALFASTVKGIHVVNPTARIQLFDGVQNPAPQVVPLADGSSIQTDRVGIRCNKTVWRNNHLLVLLTKAILSRCLPRAWRGRWLQSNPYLRAILSSKAVLDITAGDSFSDIYGLKRLLLGSIPKVLILLLGKKLILLPQTYGPFKSSVAQGLARWILRRAAGVYCRDRQGLEDITRLVGSRSMRSQPQFCPDVAFTLDPIPPDEIKIFPAPLPPKGTKIVIGFNVSGLLYNGGYTRDNSFGLMIDYRQLQMSLLDVFLQKPDTAILLVPHVYPESEFAVESDPQACKEVFDQFKDRYPERIFLVEGKYDQSEIKFIIGQCDFFLGSRMHACIAAMSQGIPAVGLAYSKKFQGVFESVGVGECVIDMRSLDQELVIRTVEGIFKDRQRIRSLLDTVIPATQNLINSIFKDLDKLEDPNH